MSARLAVVERHMHFKRVKTLGRLGAQLALEGDAGILVQVADVRLEHVGPRERLAAEQAAGQACNRGQSVR